MKKSLVTMLLVLAIGGLVQQAVAQAAAQPASHARRSKSKIPLNTTRTSTPSSRAIRRKKRRRWKPFSRPIPTVS